MPELPEVESTVRKMQLSLPDETFSRVKLQWARCWSHNSLPTRLLRGAIVRSVSRRGKYILIELTPRADRAKKTRAQTASLYLVIHLRMSGRIDIDCKAGEYHRVQFEMESGLCWHLRDPRKFGRMTLCHNPDALLAHLGPEPFDPALSGATLASIFSIKKRAIKPLLLDQSVLAGLGNIYVDEVLWQCRIHPLTPASSLKQTTVTNLLRCMRKILREAIELHGTDFGDYVVADGRYTPRAYGRLGKPCSRCKRPIQRIVVGQRGTYFCGRCQVG